MERKNYMEEVDAWLDALLDKLLWLGHEADADKIAIALEKAKREIKAKILESFKNGKSSRYSKNRTGTYANSQTNTQGTAQRGNSADDRTTSTVNAV